MTGAPEDLRELDQKLRAIRFGPRASLEPELLGRVRRGDLPVASPIRSTRRSLLAAAAGLAAVSALAFARLGPLADPEAVTIDRCCYDLDGGREADDGVLVQAERDDRVHRLRVYEDRDRSGGYTAGDLVRLDRGGKPAMHGLAGEGLITIERCCLDFDGGGPEDDGLLVLGVPPDRVIMAAIYETGSRALAPNTGWLLR